MERRDVLVRIGSLLVALPAARLLSACGGSDGGGGGGMQNPTQLTFVSSNDLGHSHATSLQVTELTTPPTGGVTKTTTNVQAHTHQVTLSEAELASIHGGGTVTKTTTTDDGHSHTFSFHA